MGKTSSRMVTTNTLMCQTDSAVDAATSTPLMDPMTGLPAVIPEGAAVSSIDVYRNGDSGVSGGATIQLGLVGDAARYINVSDSFTTDTLNNCHIIRKNLGSDAGLTAATELRLVVSSALSSGGLVFEIKYVSF